MKNRALVAALAAGLVCIASQAFAIDLFGYGLLNGSYGCCDNAKMTSCGCDRGCRDRCHRDRCHRDRCHRDRCHRSWFNGCGCDAKAPVQAPSCEAKGPVQAPKTCGCDRGCRDRCHRDRCNRGCRDRCHRDRCFGGWFNGCGCEPKCGA